MKWLSLLIISFMLLTGCAGQTKLPDPELPAVASQDWVQQFQSPTLSRLVADAGRLNASVNAATARLVAAHARTKIQQAAQLPSVGASAQAGRSRTVSASGSATNNNFKLGVDVSWQADLWNRLEFQSAASIANRNAAVADFQAAHLSLAGDIATSWFSAIEAAAQNRLAQRRVASFESTLTTIRSRYQSGVGNALDLRLSQENLASAQASKAASERALDAALRQLEALAGHNPTATLKLDEKLPQLTKPLPPGLSAELLQRRPDIVAAQQRLLASNLGLQQTRKNHLPGLMLTGSTGLSSTELKDLLDLDRLIWTIAASISQSIFDGGKLSAEKLLADANHREVVANYSQTMLHALREVETLLAAEPLLQQQEAATLEAVEQSQAATELALSRYKGGLSNIITLLDTQRRSFSAESNLLSIRLTRLLNRINLHLALGGDFPDNKT